MDKNLVVFLGILLALFLLALIISLGFGLYILYKKNPDVFQQKNLPEKSKKEITPLDKTSELIPDVLEENCKNHSEKRAEALCAICMDAFCEKCSVEENKLNFCAEHYKLYHKNNWVKIDEVRTTPDLAEESEYLYKFKRLFWKTDKAPMIIETHYQINVDHDQIESQISLFVTETQSEQLRSELKKTTSNQERI